MIHIHSTFDNIIWPNKDIQFSLLFGMIRIQIEYLVQPYFISLHTHTQPFYCWSGICPGPPGSVGTRKVKPRRLKPIWIYWSKR